jgi:hypothetical protein
MLSARMALASSLREGMQTPASGVRRCRRYGITPVPAAQRTGRLDSVGGDRGDDQEKLKAQFSPIGGQTASRQTRQTDTR